MLARATRKIIPATGKPNVSLTLELKRIAAAKLRRGMHQNPSEVIRKVAPLLKERDEQLESLRRDIGEGFEAVEDGDFIDLDVAKIQRLAGRAKTRGRKHFANKARKTGTR